MGLTIAEILLKNLKENNADPEAYWEAKMKAQAKGKGVVPAVRGPQSLDAIDPKTDG